MKERPILFSGPMVRAIIEGRKTQTRRVVKRPPSAKGGTDFGPRDRLELCMWNGGWQWVDKHGNCGCEKDAIRCPYASGIGDRLWVRETWASVNPNWRPGTRSKQPLVNYRATDEIGPCLRWRPSLFMPRWASRITLEVTDVWVERLQDISEEDAKSEGAYEWITSRSGRAYENDMDDWAHFTRRVDPGAKAATMRGAFGYLWDSINATKAPWKANPWVWVINFKRIEADAKRGAA